MDCACGGLGEAIDHAQQCRLAGARPADDAKHLTCWHIQIDGIHRDDGTEPARQAAKAERFRHKLDAAGTASPDTPRSSSVNAAAISARV